MLSQKERLQRGSTLFTSRKYTHGRFVRVSIGKSTLSSFRVSVVISKKVVPKAVDRNTLRRRLYDGLKPILSMYPHTDFIVVLKAFPNKQLTIKAIIVDIQQTIALLLP